MRIDVEGATKRYRETLALDNVSLSFSTGHIYGLFGRNGAGKSTLMKSISNRIGLDRGKIAIENRLVKDSPDDFGKICHVGEENLFPSSSRVREIFKLFAAETGADEKDMSTLADAFALDTKSKWEKLSTGYRTIFKDILALSSPAAFILLDEPILGLDANHRELLYEEILKRATEDKCFVISTHIIEEVSHLVDEIAIIHHGRIIVKGPLEEELKDVRLVSGSEDAVRKAVENAAVVSARKFGKISKYTVKGPVDTVDGTTVETLDLQKYFVELTR